MKNIEKIIKEELEGLNYSYILNEEEFKLCVWDNSRKMDEGDMIDIVENCLYKICEELSEENKEDFIDEINSDIWYSGFKNVEKEDLGMYCSNSLDFSFEFE